MDVARAAGLAHVAGCTGSTSERTVRAEYDLPDIALLDMGDFAGAVLKYVRRHPVDRLTVCGGFAKLSKLAAGHLDLHSARSQVDKAFLADLARTGGADEDLAARIATANTGLEALRLCEAAGVPWATWWRPAPGTRPCPWSGRAGRGGRALHRPGGGGGGAGMRPGGPVFAPRRILASAARGKRSPMLQRPKMCQPHGLRSHRDCRSLSASGWTLSSQGTYAAPRSATDRFIPCPAVFWNCMPRTSAAFAM